MPPMTEFETKALLLLTSIDASLKRLVVFANARQARSKGDEIASEKELDSKHGDEKVSFDPRDWKGPSFKGSRMSECPPEFLDQLARACDFFADKNDRGGVMTTGPNPVPKSTFDRRTASRARGWAKRKRDGWKPPPPPPPMGDDDAGFGDGATGSGNFPTSGSFGTDDEDPFGSGDEPVF